ncbi:ABC transporter substrate-binding protein [Acetobacteraceae bacterium H6797]|nr:ABC transporter substrate-binding protein [Acetobacteraceae bacterium H6797]
MTSLTRRTFTVAGLSTLLCTGQAGAADLAQVTLRIGDQTGASRSKLQAAGLLKDVPYKIDWSVHAAAVNLHEALKADAIDIGSANDSPTVSAIAGGSRIAAVAGWYNGAGAVLLSPKGSAVRQIADLRGRTISPTTRGSVAHYLVVAALRQAGIGLDEVKLAFLTPADASAAFSAGSIDAWGTWGVYKARALGTLGAQVVTDGAGLNSGLGVLSATQKVLTDPLKVAAIADFADRLDRGYAWSRANREAHIRWYAAFTRQDEATAALLYEDDAAYRRVPIDDRFVARLRETYDTWRAVGILSGEIDWARYVYRDLPIAQVPA